jgi:zinc transporter
MKSLAEHDGLLYSAKMDSGGKYVPLDLESIPVTANDREYHWLQMCATHLDTRRYLEENTHLDSLVIDALLAEDTRPRVLQRDDGTMLILRAMNFTPGGKPEDMISLRMWITQGCILSFRLRDALAIDDLKAMIASNRAPDRIGNFVTAITDRVYSRMEPVIDQLVDDTAILEELVARKEANEAFDNKNRHIAASHCPSTRRSGQIDQITAKMVAERRYRATDRERRPDHALY